MTRITLLVALLTAPLAAQAQDSSLTIARRLATEGQGDSARALVRAKLRQTAPGDSLYPFILFTAGLIAGDVDSARTYFRRVSIEYASSPWADDALLKLAQFAFASNDFSGAARTARRIVLDFPLSDVRPEAVYWTARAELELGEVAAACQHLAAISADTTADVELLNRVRYYEQRCTGVAAGGLDTTGGGAPDTTPARQPTFAVQVAAVSSVAAADEVMRSLTTAGYQPRVVRDADGLWKVRVGRFPDRAAAQRLSAELKSRLNIQQPFVVEER